MSTEPATPIPGADKKLPAGLLAIFLGTFAVQKFYLGYKKEGIILLIVSLITCGFVGWAVGIIDGIIYLTKSDAEFVATYVNGRKPWF